MSASSYITRTQPGTCGALADSIYVYAIGDTMPYGGVSSYVAALYSNDRRRLVARAFVFELPAMQA